VNDRPRVLGNRYEVGDLLGRGGMAEVHLGRDTRLGRVVAIKLLRTDLARDPIFQARFRREAQSAAALNHSAIVAVYDTGEEQVVDGGGALVALPYIVMEYVEGRTLRELLFERGPLELSLAVELTAGVLSALEYSHRAGIVHRDIKPANVMLTPDGDVKVMDFGIARALADVSATMTQTQAVIGTAQYLSPEQARGETVDPRSDLYSAGCLLFELCTGRPPFVADSPVAVAYQHVREAPPRPSSLNPAIGEALDRVILHSLAKDRETRYQSAAEFRADLENLRQGRTVSAPAAVLAEAARGDQAATTEYLAQQPATRALTNPAGPAGQPGGFGPLQVPVDGDQPGRYDPAAYPTYSTPAHPTPDYPTRDRRRQSERSSGRGLGLVLLGLVAVAVFAAVGYLVYSLVGGREPQQVAVARVTGLTEAVATSMLEQQGLKVSVTKAANETIPAGVVSAQDPAQGAQVDRGTSVALTVSSGSSNAQVPDVANFTQEQAKLGIEGAGLTVGSTETVDDASVEKGKVVKTEPAAGQDVAKGTAVKLFISSGQVEVPDVTNKSFTEASAILAELRISVVRQDEQSDQPEGSVLSQSEQAGSKVDPRKTTITLRVAVPLDNPPPTDEPSPGPTDGGTSTDQPSPPT
jgi:beta-lactam-binding protein with PASTA domain/predicted Ser/Thr protein kinase